MMKRVISHGYMKLALVKTMLSSFPLSPIPVCSLSKTEDHTYRLMDVDSRSLPAETDVVDVDGFCGMMSGRFKGVADGAAVFGAGGGSKPAARSEAISDSVAGGFADVDEVVIGGCSDGGGCGWTG